MRGRMGRPCRWLHAGVLCGDRCRRGGEGGTAAAHCGLRRTGWEWGAGASLAGFASASADPGRRVREERLRRSCSKPTDRPHGHGVIDAWDPLRISAGSIRLPRAEARSGASKPAREHEGLRNQALPPTRHAAMGGNRASQPSSPTQSRTAAAAARNARPSRLRFAARLRSRGWGVRGVCPSLSNRPSSVSLEPHKLRLKCADLSFPRNARIRGERA
jgi:hypothetical protein